MKMNFYIKHKESGLFFAGFGSDQECLWGDKNNRRVFESALGARCQASLLICHGENVFRRLYGDD